MEAAAAQNTGQVIVAKEDGNVIYADGSRIEVLYKSGEKWFTNSTISAEPTKELVSTNALCVKVVKKSARAISFADGAATEHGDLAIGQNVLVAYMPWEGYNFEDAVIISSRLVEHDRFSSIHIQEFTVDIRDTKLGPEVVTRDIPNVVKVASRILMTMESSVWVLLFVMELSL